MFSFNSPYGACPTCTRPRHAASASTRSSSFRIRRSPSSTAASARAAGTASRMTSISRMYYDALAEKYHFDLATPIGDLPEHVREILLYGTGDEELTLHYDSRIAATACCAARLRASSATLSAAIRRRSSDAMRRHRSRTAWRRPPARTATARGCGRRCWPSRSAG